MRRFILFAIAFSAVVAAGALLPFNQSNGHAVAAAAPQGNWSSGTCPEKTSQGWGGWGQARACELRRTTLTLSASHLSLDTTNGGIEVMGEDRPDVAIEATIRAWAPTDSDVRNLLGQIVIDTAGGNIHDHGPHSAFFNRSGYSVSYRLRTPRRLAAEFHTMNGGVELTRLNGTIRFSTTNGGVTLDQLNGDVQGHSVNGGLNISLAGDHWLGKGLDAQTTNGGVTLSLPTGYSAHLEASTVNGGISVDFPVTVQGEIRNHLDTDIGNGGPTIHAQTVNGGISIGHTQNQSGNSD